MMSPMKIEKTFWRWWNIGKISLEFHPPRSRRRDIKMIEIPHFWRIFFAMRELFITQRRRNIIDDSAKFQILRKEKNRQSTDSNCPTSAQFFVSESIVFCCFKCNVDKFFLFYKFTFSVFLLSRVDISAINSSLDSLAICIPHAYGFIKYWVQKLIRLQILRFSSRWYPLVHTLHSTSYCISHTTHRIISSLSPSAPDLTHSVYVD